MVSNMSSLPLDLLRLSSKSSISTLAPSAFSLIVCRDFPASARASSVAWSTCPVTFRPASFWNAATAARVSSLNTPLTPYLLRSYPSSVSAVWIFFIDSVASLPHAIIVSPYFPGSISLRSTDNPVVASVTLPVKLSKAFFR